MSRWLWFGLCSAVLLVLSGCADAPETLALSEGQAAETTTSTSAAPSTSSVDLETSTTVARDEVVAVITDDTGFDEASLAALTGEPNPEPITLEQLNSLIPGEIEVFLESVGGEWTPELWASARDCHVSLASDVLRDEDLVSEEELELILADWEPWSAAGDAIADSFELDEGPSESGVRYVECFGTPDEFVSIFVGGLFDADVEDCLASRLTVEARFDVLRRDRWTELLEACGWDPRQ